VINTSRKREKEGVIDTARGIGGEPRKRGLELCKFRILKGKKARRGGSQRFGEVKKGGGRIGRLKRARRIQTNPEKEGMSNSKWDQ